MTLGQPTLYYIIILIDYWYSGYNVPQSSSTALRQYLAITNESWLVGEALNHITFLEKLCHTSDNNDKERFVLLTHQYNHVYTVQILTTCHIRPYAVHGLGPIYVECTCTHVPRNSNSSYRYLGLTLFLYVLRFSRRLRCCFNPSGSTLLIVLVTQSLVLLIWWLPHICQKGIH